MNTSTITRLRDHIDAIRSEIEPLTERLQSLESDLKRAESLHFIAENGITADDVEMHDGDGRPWFWDIEKFYNWLKLNSEKPWAGWNGRIYRIKDPLSGLMLETKGRTADLLKTKPEATK